MSADRAWAWVAALRAGSTTPWTQWVAESAETAAPTGRDLPGAHQLELVRRVNLAVERGTAAASRAEVTTLVERILTASPTGRGVPDRDLIGAVPERSWGLPPVDPSDLADCDLLPVAARLVAEDLLASGPQPEPSQQGRPTAPRRVVRRLSRTLRRDRGHQVVGAPWQAWTARDELMRRGRALGGPEHPRHAVVVVGQDPATMLVDAYTARAFDTGGPAWEGWLRSGPGRSLPRRADLAVIAATWAATTDRDRLVLVVDPESLPHALGLPTGALGRLTPPRPTAAAVDLARRVAPPLGLWVPAKERRRLLRRVLLPQLLADAETHPSPSLALPEAALPRVRRRAERVREQVAAAGYPVAGDLQRLLPDPGHLEPSGTCPDDAEVLALAIRVLLGATPPTTRGAER
ncbi:hypothetical protein [Nocardioides sp.]|uniref:hypothetical protein n=1 Tax=Nocardioides sp. TaxID=35761 RepID=UPI002B27187D|nr:hypothetical protein [Nocardioides sp.]